MFIRDNTKCSHCGSSSVKDYQFDVFRTSYSLCKIVALCQNCEGETAAFLSVDLGTLTNLVLSPIHSDFGANSDFNIKRARRNWLAVLESQGLFVQKKLLDFWIREVDSSGTPRLGSAFLDPVGAGVILRERQVAALRRYLKSLGCSAPSTQWLPFSYKWESAVSSMSFSPPPLPKKKRTERKKSSPLAG